MQIVNALDIPRDASRTPLFQTLFTVNEGLSPSAEAPDVAGIVLQELDTANENGELAKFDLEMALNSAGKELQLEMIFCSDLFSASTIEYMARHYIHLLSEVATKHSASCAQLALMEPAELQMTTVAWNQTVSPFPQGACLHELVEEQARQTPGATALVLGAERLSYAKLMRRVAALSTKLRRYEVGPGVMVAMLVERSFEMVIGLLAVLKAGGAYVPIDSAYPVQRVGYILQDTEAPVMLVQSHTRQKVRREVI